MLPLRGGNISEIVDIMTGPKGGWLDDGVSRRSIELLIEELTGADFAPRGWQH